MPLKLLREDARVSSGDVSRTGPCLGMLSDSFDSVHSSTGASVIERPPALFAVPGLTGVPTLRISMFDPSLKDFRSMFLVKMDVLKDIPRLREAGEEGLRGEVLAGGESRLADQVFGTAFLLDDWFAKSVSTDKEGFASSLVVISAMAAPSKLLPSLEISSLFLFLLDNLLSRSVEVRTFSRSPADCGLDAAETSVAVDCATGSPSRLKVRVLGARDPCSSSMSLLSCSPDLLRLTPLSS